MDDASSIASLHGMLSVVLGIACASLVYYVGIRGPARNKWVAGFRFSLWSIILPALYLGGGISRLVLGIPESSYSMTLEQRLFGLLGFYMAGFIVLFPVGVDRAEKRLGLDGHSLEGSKRATGVDPSPSGSRIARWHWGQLTIVWIASTLLWALTGSFAYDWDFPDWLARLLLIVVIPAIPLAITWKWFAARTSRSSPPHGQPPAG